MRGVIGLYCLVAITFGGRIFGTQATPEVLKSWQDVACQGEAITPGKVIFNTLKKSFRTRLKDIKRSQLGALGQEKRNFIYASITKEQWEEIADLGKNSTHIIEILKAIILGDEKAAPLTSFGESDSSLIVLHLPEKNLSSLPSNTREAVLLNIKYHQEILLESKIPRLKALFAGKNPEHSESTIVDLTNLKPNIIELILKLYPKDTLKANQNKLKNALSQLKENLKPTTPTPPTPPTTPAPPTTPTTPAPLTTPTTPAPPTTSTAPTNENPIPHSNSPAQSKTTSSFQTNASSFNTLTIGVIIVLGILGIFGGVFSAISLFSFVGLKNYPLARRDKNKEMAEKTLKATKKICR